MVFPSFHECVHGIPSQLLGPFRFNPELFPHPQKTELISPFSNLLVPSTFMGEFILSPNSKTSRIDQGRLRSYRIHHLRPDLLPHRTPFINVLDPYPSSPPSPVTVLGTHCRLPGPHIVHPRIQLKDTDDIT